MKEGWKEIKLGEVTEYIKRGVTPKYVKEDGICVINQKCIRDGVLSFDDARLTSKQKKVTPEKLIQIGDVLINSTGTGTLGRTAPVRKLHGPTTVDTHVTIVRANESLDSLYLGYLLRYSEPLITLLGKGATNQIELAASDLNVMKITIPKSKETQRKIAAILSAYDDLIENNLKRIKLLEEKAQLTYEEWFVRMKFPRHETTPIDKETGLPEGWEKKGLDSLCTKITDGTHDSPKAASEGYKLITGKHISNGFIDFETAYLISTEDHENIKKRSGLEKGDILFSNIGTLGNIGMVTEDFEYSCKNVIIFKFKKGYSSFLFSYLSDNYTRLKLDAQSSGVAQKFYSLKLIRNYKDNFPGSAYILDFDKVVGPLIQLKFDLHKQNQLLKEARDILLPRLMTGMIDVETLDLSAFEQGDQEQMLMAAEPEIKYNKD